MKKILIVFALTFFVLSSNAAFSQVVSEKNSRDLKFTSDEQFSREEAARDLKRVALEVEKANAELEELRLEAEGSLAEDVMRAQQETDLMAQELGLELSMLYREAEKEAQVRRKELEKEKARIRNQAFEAIEQMTQELDKDLKRIKLRPPRP